MYIQDRDVAQFFQVDYPHNDQSAIEGLSRKLFQNSDENDGIVLLWEERTLYEYNITKMYDLFGQVGSDVMMVLCSSLTAAKWSSERKWINTQQHISNFNVNICLRVSREISNSVWALQEKIATAITQTLIRLRPDHQFQIAYPLHYLMDGWKVAGHLVQKIRLDAENDFLRIGIGTNTANIPPVLPKNDHLAEHLFSAPNSVYLGPEEWIRLAKKYKENILLLLQSDSAHSEYIQFLNIKRGDSIEIYEDLGTHQFWGRLHGWVFDTIHPDGSVAINRTTLPHQDYHIKKIPN